MRSTTFTFSPTSTRFNSIHDKDSAAMLNKWGVGPHLTAAQFSFSGIFRGEGEREIKAFLLDFLNSGAVQHHLGASGGKRAVPSGDFNDVEWKKVAATMTSMDGLTN